MITYAPISEKKTVTELTMKAKRIFTLDGNVQKNNLTPKPNKLQNIVFKRKSNLHQILVDVD
ncbi:hypothetical protein XF28_07845 [Escherichia coli]|nr:hypothetical protein XF28_07845 [Escherichia coli]